MTLKQHLDHLLSTYDRAHHLASDPLQFPHRYSDAGDQEVVGLVAALLAFGNVKAVRRSVERVLATLGESPAAELSTQERVHRRRLEGFVHRTWTGEDVARVLARTARIRRTHGSLGGRFAEHWREAGDLREALARWSDELRGPAPGRGLKHLVADPRAGSACKRSLLFLRWMVRPADGVDLGLWDLAPSELLIPVDTHVLRIAGNLSLTARRDASWRTAEELTERLRLFDPTDPVKYDFAICHLGISRACPSRQDDAACARCELRPVCRFWT